MEIGSEVRDAKIESRDTGAMMPRRPNRTGLVLGGLAALLIVAGGIYYLAEDRAVTGSSSGQSADSPAVGPTPRASDSSNKSVSATTPSQEPASVQSQAPQPRETQQSASAAPAPATSPVETSATPPATMAQGVAANSQSAKTEQPADSAKAAPNTAPGVVSQAGPTAPPTMRDQPAALPDQPAAAPKKENILVVMRGPANIRSAPGKQGRVIGTAAKDATVKELDRSGNWVQVETDAGTGWVNAALLGTRSPEGR